MAENFDLIFGQNASQQYAWNDTDYENGWGTIGNIPPTAAQFDALQRRSDTKMKELNDELTPLVNADTTDSRQPSTSYNVDDIKYSPLLPTGWYLLCTTRGTTSASDLVITSPAVGNTVTDGTVVWKIQKIGDVDISGKANINGSNMVYHRDVITTSGTYTVPATGLYKITVKGGGGGGGGGHHATGSNNSGAGGGEGGTTIAYAQMTAGNTASVVIGAGGAGGASESDGSNGGASSVTFSNHTYTGGGGGGGISSSHGGTGGSGTIIGAPGPSSTASGGASLSVTGTSGGGAGGGIAGSSSDSGAGTKGGGGGGGGVKASSSSNYTRFAGGAGGNGYVWFEYYTAN